MAPDRRLHRFPVARSAQPGVAPRQPFNLQPMTTDTPQTIPTMQTFSAGGVTWTGSRNLKDAIAYAKAEDCSLICGLTGPGNVLWYIPCHGSIGTLIYWQRSCLHCEHSSRLKTGETRFSEELRCKAKSEVVAPLSNPQELETVALKCPLFQKRE